MGLDCRKIKYFCIFCDNCDREAQETDDAIGNNDIEYAIEAAKSVGFREVVERWLCPDCYEEALVKLRGKEKPPRANLYFLSQDDEHGYDVYDSMVVVAFSEVDARNIHPYLYSVGSWAHSPENVVVEFLGVAKEGMEPGRIICSSFNAG